MTQDSYSIYLRSYGKLASGARLTDRDYGTLRLRRLFRPFDESGQIAMALAVQDVNQDSKLKSKGEFEAELKRLRSPTTV